MDGTITLEHLEYLERAGLIHQTGSEAEDEYLFQHALIQEAAYESLLKKDRAQLHQSVGETLERLYPDQAVSRELAPVLGRHFAEAGDDARALRYFTVAGDEATQAYANTEAITHYTQALAIAQHLDVSSEQLVHLYNRRGRALELNVEYEQALYNYEELSRAGQQRGDQALALASLVARTTLHVTPTPLFNPTQGQILAEQALALAQKLGDQTAEARSYWNLLILHTFTGQAQTAITYGERSLSLARQLELTEQLAFTLNDLHRAYLLTGQPELALAALSEACELWRRLDNLPLLADNLSNIALLSYLRGEFERTMRLAQEAFKISQAIGNDWGTATSSLGMGRVYFEQGQIDQAIEAQQRAIDLADSSGIVIGQVLSRVELAWIYGSVGAFELALSLARDACLNVEKIPANFQAWPLTILAHVEVLNNNLIQAEQALRESYLNFNQKDMGSPSFVWMKLVEAELAVSKGDFGAAVILATTGAEKFRRASIQTFLPDILLIKATALLAQQQEEAGYNTLLEGKAIAERIQSHRSLWPILCLLDQNRDKNQATEHHQSAKNTLEYVTKHISDAVLRNHFLSLPQVKAVLY